MFETTRRHLYLCGFMGTGKTAVGRALSVRLGWGFIDLDEMIEGISHLSVPDIFRMRGEDAFRDMESRALRLAALAPHSVISLGGGTPIRTSNTLVIRATGRTCWLTASWESIWGRVHSNLKDRPMLAGTESESITPEPTFEQFRQIGAALLSTREEAYSRIADFTLDTSNKTVEDVAHLIAEWFLQETI